MRRIFPNGPRSFERAQPNPRDPLLVGLRWLLRPRTSCGSYHPASGLRGPPHRTTIPRSPGPGPLRPTERPLDPPPRPQIGQTWGPSLFAQRRRWFTEGTIRELIETGRRAYFRKKRLEVSFLWRLSE